MISFQLPSDMHVFHESAVIRDLLRDHPSVESALFTDGIPADFMAQAYHADREVTVFERAGHAPVLRFGSGPLSQFFGVDLATENVIQVVVPDYPENFVNTSLAHFTQTVIAVNDKFPFYSLSEADRVMDRVAGELLKMISSIDPPAAVPDRFWSTFIDDVQNGDFSTEDVTSGYAKMHANE
jgi:hypothetical protein